MANRIVGKLGVKVIPDLSTFRADLKTKLKEVQDSVKAEIKASLNLDTTKFLTDVKAAAEAAKLEVENVKATVKVNMDPQTAQFLARVKASLNSVDKAAVSIPITPETAKFRARLAELLNGVRATMSAKIPTSPAGLEEYKAKLRAQVFLVSKEIKANIKTDVDKSSLRSARTAFGGLAGALASMENVFGGASKGTLKLAESLGSVSDQGGSVTSVFTHLGQVLSNVGQVASGIGIAFLVTLIPAALGGITLAIGALETAILAIPAVMGAAAVAAGTLFVAFKGLSSVISEGFSAKSASDLAKFHKDLAKLPPAAQVAVTAMVGLKSSFKGFQAQIQQNFFQEFAGQISSFANNVIPIVRSGMAGVATDLGMVVSGFLAWGRSIQGASAIAGALGSIDLLFARLAPLVTPVVDAFTNLTTLGVSSFLIPLATDLTNAATAFDQFVTSTKGESEIQSAFSNLHDLIVSIAGPLGDLSAKILKAFSGADSKKAIDDLGKSLQSLVNDIGPNLPKMISDFDTFAKTLDTINKLLGSDGFSAALSVVETGFVLIAFAIETVLLPFRLLKMLWDILVQSWQDAGPVMSIVILLFGDMIAIFELAGQVIKKIVDAVQQLGKMFGQQVAPIASLVSNVASAPGKMLAPFSSFSSRLGGIFSGSWANSLGITRGGVSGLVNAISGGQGRAGGAASGIANRIVGALSGLGGQMYGVGTQIVSGIVSGIESGFGWVTDTASRLAANAVAAAKAALGVHSPSRVFMNIGENVAQGFVIGMDNSHDSVATSAASLALSAVESAKTFANAMANNGIPPALIGAQFPQMAGLAGSAANDRPINVYLDNKKVGFGVTSGDRANQRRG